MSGELQRFQEQEGTEPADLAAMAEYVDNCLSSRSRSFGVFRRDHKLPTKEQMRDLRLHATYVSVDHYAPRVWELIAEMGLLARMEHVSTRDNLADNPSRGRVVVDPELLEITMTRAWGRKDMRVLGTSRTCVGAAASRRRSVPTR